MLTDKEHALVNRKIESIAAEYLEAKAQGNDLRALAFPAFDSQEDFERCRPEDQGMTFEKHNELTVEILKVLRQRGILAQPVLFRHSEFMQWLDGRPVSPEARAEFTAYLLEREQKGSRGR